MKKSIFTIFITISILFITWWNCFWHFEDKMYCFVLNKNIKVSLNRKDWIKCQSYIIYIEKKMKETYIDILTIQKYIDQKQDLWYWKPIHQDKSKFLDDLQQLRLNILKSMQGFDNSLFQTLKWFWVAETTKPKQHLINILTDINNLTGQNLNQFSRQIKLINDYLESIKALEKSEDFISLNNAYKKFLYLKKQTEWK